MSRKIDTLTIEQRSAAYLRVSYWAQARYTHAGRLELYKGNVPGVFARIEHAAWARYMAPFPATAKEGVR